jgi:hypothetical protein
MARAFMQQYYGRSNNNMYAESWDAMKGFLGTQLMPPPPPILGTMLAGFQGTVLPPGGFLGELYKRQQNQFDPGTKENNLELALRQFAPGITDIALSSLHAFETSPDVWSGGTAAFKAGLHRVEQKTSLVRDAIGVKPPVSGSPIVNDKLFKLDHTIKDISKRYNTWEVNKGDIAIKSPGVSPYGMNKVAPFMPPLPPAERNGKIPNPGISLAEPANPLYKMMMNEMEKTFNKDSPAKGGIGYRSMWKHYSIYTQSLKRLSTVTDGNSGAWVKEQDSKPKTVEFLKGNNVNPYDYRAVKDFYNHRRELTGKMILDTINATEQRIDQMPNIRQMLGPEKHFTIQMLDPDKPGLQDPDKDNQ